MARVEELESVLRRHVLEAWFPRSLDHEAGGFLCDFDRSWTSCGPHDKLLEFQARQTLTAADASRAYPDDPRYLTATLHGFRYLRDVLWDHDAGGWFHRLDRGGRPLEAETKHAHGAAYAIEACAAVYAATGDASALDLRAPGLRVAGPLRARSGARRLFRISDARQHAHSRSVPESPGFWSSTRLRPASGSRTPTCSPISLETFVSLYRVWPDRTWRPPGRNAGDRVRENG